MPTQKGCFLAVLPDISSPEANFQRDTDDILKRCGRSFSISCQASSLGLWIAHKVLHQHQSLTFSGNLKNNMISLVPSSPFCFHYDTVTPLLVNLYLQNLTDVWARCQLHRHTFFSIKPSLTVHCMRYNQLAEVKEKPIFLLIFNFNMCEVSVS